MLNIRGSSFFSSIRLRGARSGGHTVTSFPGPQQPARKVPETF